jgi:hypothetical protein
MDPWTGWSLATCMPASCFCEALHDGLVRQPANTYSCAAFLVGGLAVAYRGRSAAGATFIATPSGSLAYAAVLVVLGLGSAFYHASLTLLGQWTDVQAMYLLASIIFVANAARLGAWSSKVSWAAYLALNVLPAAALLAWPEGRRFVFAAMLVAAIASQLILEKRTTGRSRMLLAALGVLVAGGAVWVADITGTVCAPDSVFQGHAVWHFACAGAAVLAWEHHRARA